MLLTIVSFIVILSILVLVHEFGHFLTAKKFGIKVEEFGIGFPPRAFGKKIGETIYSVNWLPVGGFVKLFGEDDAGGGKPQIRNSKSEIRNEDVGRAFFARPLWQRMTVVVAGVVMNFFLAVVIISVLFATKGVAVPTEKVVITAINSNSPAKMAGIKVDDRILRINGNAIKETKVFIDETKKYKGREIKLTVQRDGREFDVMLTPREKFPKGEGPMGVAISNIEIKKYSWWQAPIYGTIEAGKFSWIIVQGLGTMVYDFVTTGAKPEGVAGPVGVAQLTGKAVQVGWVATLWFVSLLSLNLAVLNILPIPALDGGRFFFMVIEMVTRKKVSPRYEALAHAVGLVLLLGLMALITAVDISRLIQGKSILP